MGTTVLEQFALTQLQPIQYPDLARREAVAFGPNLVILPGMLVGKKTSDGLVYPYTGNGGHLKVPTAPVATKSATGGVLAASTYTYKVTAVNGSGETTSSSASTGVTTTGSTSKVTLTWTTVPGATSYNVYGRSGTQTLLSAVTAVAGSNSQTFTDDGSLSPSGAQPGSNTATVADGTEKALGINEYSIVTDASGNVYLSDTTAGPSYRLSPKQTSPIFVKGTFDPADLTFLDSNAVTSLGGRYLVNGFLMIP